MAASALFPSRLLYRGFLALDFAGALKWVPYPSGHPLPEGRRAVFLPKQALLGQGWLTGQRG